MILIMLIGVVIQAAGIVLQVIDLLIKKRDKNRNHP